MTFLLLRIMSLLPLGDSLFLLSISREDLLMYVSVALTSSVKFLFGVLAALGFNFVLWETLAFAAGGAFVGAVIFTYFWSYLQKLYDRYFPHKPASFARRRRLHTFWKRYGLPGVAFMIPIFSPMVSIGIALSFRERPGRIILAITLAIIGWTLLLTALKDAALQLLT